MYFIERQAYPEPFFSLTLQDLKSGVTFSRTFLLYLFCSSWVGEQRLPTNLLCIVILPLTTLYSVYLFVWFVDSLPGGSVVKNLLASAGDVVRSLGREDSLEKEVATHSSILNTHISILAWRIPWTEETDRLQSMVWLKSRT